MKKIIPFLLLLFSIFVHGQVKTNFNNTKLLTQKGVFQHDHKNFLLPVAAPDTSVIAMRKSQDVKESGTPKPFRFAEKINVDIDFVKEANWIIEDTFEYGKLTIVSAKAKSLSIFFNHFYLPDNTEMYVYNSRGVMISGPITSVENNQDSTWGSSPMQGDSITIETKIPAGTRNSLRLNISVIGYGYKSIFAGGFGTSAACEINVLCALGANWGNQRIGVAKVIGNQGTVFFTGQLVMNTCGTNIPYFLTAWHAVDAFVGTWQFIFNYWSPTCTPNQNNANTLQFNGAVLESDNMASDFALVRLNQTPAANSNISYLGWNRAAAAAANTVGIHHPEGDVMKICADANPPILAAFNAIPFNNPALNWWRAHFQQGTVEPGSSGSALFDQNQRIVGQLSGDPNNMGNYCAQQIGEYGRFDLSWAGGGTNATRLSNWLDPTNTGAVTTNTTAVSALVNTTNVIVSGGLSQICTSQTYIVNTTSPVTWTVVPAGIVNFSCTNCNTTTVTKVGSGAATITATTNTACGGGVAASLPVQVGAPYVGINYSQWGACQGAMQAWQCSASSISYGSNWHWTVGYVGTGSSIYIVNPYSNSTFVDVTGGGVVNLNYTDLCGAAAQNGVTLYSNCHRAAIISPNPSSGVVSVSTTSNDNATADNATLKDNPAAATPWKIYHINVIGQSGSVLRSFSYPKGITSVNLDLGGLLNGTYTLQIYDNFTWASQQVIILR
jgi:hypothetical protein